MQALDAVQVEDRAGPGPDRQPTLRAVFQPERQVEARAGHRDEVGFDAHPGIHRRGRPTVVRAAGDADRQAAGAAPAQGLGHAFEGHVLVFEQFQQIMADLAQAPFHGLLRTQADRQRQEVHEAADQPLHFQARTPGQGHADEQVVDAQFGAEHFGEGL